MRRYGILLAIGLLVLVNIVVLGGVAYNRSGEADATIVLTERELPLGSYSSYADRENTGLSLRLDWEEGSGRRGKLPHLTQRGGQQTAWFDQARLAAIGFDVTMPLEDPRAELHYSKMLPRKTYAVLEYGGNAWDAWLAEGRRELAGMEAQAKKGVFSQKQLKERREELARDVRTHSRLFAIDAGNDPAALRQQYPDRARCLILPAAVRLMYYGPTDGEKGGKVPPRLLGSVDEVLTDVISVPKGNRPMLEKLLRTTRSRGASDFSRYAQRDRGPAYEVKLQVGKRFEPWVAEVSELTPTIR